MANITFEPSTITLPNITVTEKYADGVLSAYRLTANEGYVMYDTAANDIAPMPDPETGEIIPVPITYYFREATIPINVPLEKWSWRAVREETAAEVI